MKHLLLVSYIVVIIVCQIIWYKKRKQLPDKLKKLDMKKNAVYDLSTLFILFFGYGFLFLYPSKMTFYVYLVIADIAGLLILTHYLLMMTKNQFSKSYTTQSAFLFAIQYFLTISLGFYLIIIYNVS